MIQYLNPQSNEIFATKYKKKNKQKTKNIQPTYTKQKEDNQLADTTEIGNEDSLPNMAPFQNADDLKRAVIYSEILNRKYS